MQNNEWIHIHIKADNDVYYIFIMAFLEIKIEFRCAENRMPPSIFSERVFTLNWITKIFNVIKIVDISSIRMNCVLISSYSSTLFDFQFSVIIMR